MSYDIVNVNVNAKAREKVVKHSLDGIGGNTLKSIQSKGKLIREKYRSFSLNALEIGKLLGEVQVLFNNNEQFFAYAEYECGMAESTTYAAMATYEAWQFADMKTLPGLFSPSVLSILAGKDQQELRARVVELAKTGHNITANMARNAVKLYKAGLAAGKLTAANLADPSGLLPGSDSKQDNGTDKHEYDFDSGKNVKVKVIVCGEADNADILNALEDGKKDFPIK